MTNILKMLNKKVRRGKRGVLVAVPSHSGFVRAEGYMKAWGGGAASMQSGFPFILEPYMVLERYPIADARNDCSEYFMDQTSHEHLVMIDDDMGWPDNWPSMVGHGDIVSGLTWMWCAARPPEKRLQFNQFKINKDGVSETVRPEFGDMKPYYVDIVGTACMVIHRRVFEKLGPRPFEEITGPDGKRAMGEDMAFCRKARAAGFKVQIRPDVIFNHFKTVGLKEVYESMAALTSIAHRTGYEEGVKAALAEIRKHGSQEAAGPALKEAIAAAGGAA